MAELTSVQRKIEYSRLFINNVQELAYLNTLKYTYYIIICRRICQDYR